MSDLRRALVEGAQGYDDLADPEHLADLALERLSWRVRRAGARRCVVCGDLLLGAREDAETCSGACREKRRYQRSKPDV